MPVDSKEAKPTPHDDTLITSLTQLTRDQSVTWTEFHRDWCYYLQAPAGRVQVETREPTPECGGWLLLIGDRGVTRTVAFPEGHAAFTELVILIRKQDERRAVLNQAVAFWRDKG